MGFFDLFRPSRPSCALYDKLCDPERLTLAWKHVRKSKTAGIDGVNVRAFERAWPQNMADIARAVQERSYHPLPLRRYLIAKPDGRSREIAILALRDRILQRAVYELVLPRFEEAASPSSFGYRPGLSVDDAVAQVVAYREQGLSWVVNADIERFFDTIDPRRALAAFGRIVPDPALIALVGEWIEIGLFRVDPVTVEPERTVGDLWGEIQSQLLPPLRQHLGIPPDAPLRLPSPQRAAIMAGAISPVVTRIRPSVARYGAIAAGLVAGAGLAIAAGSTMLRHQAKPIGIPQGSVLSPLLANSYLIEVDRTLARRGLAFVRYADNLALLCRDEPSARQAQATLDQALARERLRLNPAKTEVVPYDAGFTFLGERFPRYDLAAGGPPATFELVQSFASSLYWQARRRAAR